MQSACLSHQLTGYIQMLQDSSTAYPPISDYAIIGDCRSSALISRSGSIDWLCWPQFESPSIFGRILDWSRGGHFSITPLEPFEVDRRYVGDTNVLETTFITDSGRATLLDLMPVARDRSVSGSLPFRSILRRLEGKEGTIRFQLAYEPRPRYGQHAIRLSKRSSDTVFCAMPGMHPRMASDSDGPDPTPALEPPGLLALNYGYRSPLVTVAAHVLYGILLGIFLPV